MFEEKKDFDSIPIYAIWLLKIIIPILLEISVLFEFLIRISLFENSFG